MKHRNHILHHFKKTHDYVEKYGNAYLKDSGLTLAQGHIIGCLLNDEEHQATMKEVEKGMKVAQSTTAGMIARLESNGFVTTFSLPNDKRIKMVKLTQKGIDSTVRVEECMTRVENDLFRCLTKEEKETLEVLLEKVTDNY